MVYEFILFPCYIWWQKILVVKQHTLVQRPRHVRQRRGSVPAPPEAVGLARFLAVRVVPRAVVDQHVVAERVPFVGLALTPGGCQIGCMCDQNSTYGLRSLPGRGVRLVYTRNAMAAINAKLCKITKVHKVPTLPLRAAPGRGNPPARAVAVHAVASM
jgi:hypothetical protein